jgi:carbonic anhydrase/acetyltransferase-like protein (isoleucine patch superfamily)
VCGHRIACVCRVNPAAGAPARRGAAIVDGLIVSLSDHSPDIGPGAYVHDAACVIGRVSLGRDVSVWPNATIRGDTDRISVGPATNVQDGAVLHADAGSPCTIGRAVTIGHLACVHGCTVEDEVLVGIGAIILNGSVVGAGSIVGAGAVLTEGTIVPPGSLVLGTPARVVRETTDAQRAGIRRSAEHYVAMIDVHRDSGDAP